MRKCHWTISLAPSPWGLLRSLALLAGLVAALPAAALDPFVPAPRGCSLAHCDTRMSDLVGIAPPVGDVQLLWRRNELPGEKAGSGGGIGCAGNGSSVVCSFRGKSDNVIAYDRDGNRLWTSGDLLNFTSRASVPMVASDGGAIAADDTHLIRFDPSGKVLWSAAHLGGTPISPVITANGAIILATNNGPISAYDSRTGALLADLRVKIDANDEGAFETINTPSVRGNRIYVTMRHANDQGVVDDDKLNSLVAVDFNLSSPDPSQRLKVAWRYEYGGPSNASPLRIGDTLFFDADRPDFEAEDNPHLIAVRDLGGKNFEEVWRAALVKSIVVSAAQDPRGGLWVFPTGKRFGLPIDLQERLNPDIVNTGNMQRFSEVDGSLLSEFRIDDLLGVDSTVQHFRATSAMTIADLDGTPVMILNVTSYPAGLVLIPDATKIIAIDLVAETLLWQVDLPAVEGATFGAQFPIVEKDGVRRIIFTTEYNGTWALGLADGNAEFLATPLPGALPLLASALLGAGWLRRRRRCRADARRTSE